MLKIVSVFLFILLHQTCFSADTTWLNGKWRKTEKEAAVFYSLCLNEGSLWHQQMFYTKNKQLYMDGYYSEPSCTIKTGIFKWFNKNGLLTDSIVYQKGVALYMCNFHENGKKKTILTRNLNNAATYVNSWDQFGNESYIDTFYHDSKGGDCNRDTAFLKGIINKEDSVWRLRFYFVSNDSLYTTGYFKERLCKTRLRYGAWYQRGLLRDSILFNDNGKKIAAWYYFNNGNKNAYQSFDSTGKLIFARNWDEDGNEIKADTLNEHAVPIDKYKTWEKNLLNRINNDNSLDWKYRRDLYSSVYISFFVNEDGTLKSAAISEASLYPAMDTLILNVCKETLLWKPCTAHGRRRTCIRVKCFSYVAGKVLKAKDMYY